ncbi:hypothetical protein SEPCBS119000_005857 [Sporothrix epigloea]|uniref:Uncharacterized protein n=1 Tax=Sporothrix epigloea TaxID=1892477 RepID=A0ABP0E3U8_9PEZI
MIRRLRDVKDEEVVKKQLLTKGNVINVSAADVAPGLSAAGSSSLPTTAALSPDSFAVQNNDLVELLDQDDRPTFVVDTIKTENDQATPLNIVFVNAALQSLPSILDCVSGAVSILQLADPSYGDNAAEFRQWVLAPTAEPVVKQEPVAFVGWRWSASILRKRFRVVYGIGTDVAAPFPSQEESASSTILMRGISPTPSCPPNDSDYNAEADQNLDSGKPDTIRNFDLSTAPTILDAKPSFDWTRIAITDEMPEHIRFARSVNWAATPLGPIEQWSGDLRTIANLVMASPHPAAMYWGPRHTTIYNEAYMSLAGQKHPQLMGADYQDSWPEIWEAVEPIFDSAWNAGQALLKQDNHLFIQRHGFLEETFFNWSLVPVVGSDGSVVALYNPAFENTRRKVNERRMLTLNELGEKTATAQSVHDFWQSVREGLDYNEYDIPFALIYSVVGSSSSNGDDESEVSSILSNNLAGPPSLVLEGSLGVSHNHSAVVHALDLRTSDEGFAPYMRQAMAAPNGGFPSATLSPVVLSAEDGTLPTELLSELRAERGFIDPCHTVVVFPVQHPSVMSTGPEVSSASVSISGFIVMGTNPRRPYNRDYRLFVHLLARQLTTSLASVVLYEEEVRHSQRAAHRAAQDRRELSQQLQITTQQAVDSENRFMRMAEFTPVGMFVADGAGRITYCNDMWWEISRHPRQTIPDATISPVLMKPTDPLVDEKPSVWETWMDGVQEEDQPGLAAVWQRLVTDKVIITQEFRFKHKTTIQSEGGESIETTTWVLLRAYPEKDDEGHLKGIFGCITDISQQKLAEEFQIQLRKEAVEHKRQQENFIDITSHEMRNPLSAILQTVDEITSTINELRKQPADGQREKYERAFHNIQEASNTITLCTNHQKRIVDDVLTLSKLDSRLLPVTPVDVQPVMVIRGTLKMFEPELIAHDIKCTFRVQPSYQELVGFGNWVKLDPSRLNQVLINLLTNAIKFTQSCEERSIVVSLGASDCGADPTRNDAVDSVTDISYLPSRQDSHELAEGLDWGNGDLINIHIAVSDTGKGLEEDEKSKLFQHFSQTSPRTHVQYNGSGLGLYISRNLTELQGGEIGVASKQGRGSTFAFYVKSRKVSSTPPGIQAGASNITSIISRPTTPAQEASIIAYTSGGLEDGSGSCTCQMKTASASSTFMPHVPSPPVLLEQPPLSDSLGEKSARQSPAKWINVSPAATASTVVTDQAAPATAKPADSTSSGPPSSAATHAADSFKSVWCDMPTLDVLIVEDNIVNQRVLQRQLDKCGNRTMVANHGGEALDILLQATSISKTAAQTPAATDAAEFDFSTKAPLETPASMAVSGQTTSSAMAPSNSSASTMPLGSHVSIILLDLEMPVMDGMTCARAIRALERSGTLSGHVPIIAVTAYARPEQIEAALAAGIDDVISKPFRLAQLTPKIQELVARYPVYPQQLKKDKLLELSQS